MDDAPKRFFERLRARLPRHAPKLTTFPSGTFMIDVPIEGEVYVVESLAENGFGVSRQSTAVFGWEGVENAFATFEQVEDYFVALSHAETKNEKPA